LLRSLAAATIGLSIAGTTYAQAAEAQRARFGATADGAPIEAVTLSNGHGMSARIIAYGAALQSLRVPDRAGRVEDVVLAYPDMAGYLAKPQYFGATVGRYANRIAKGAFGLDGRRYTLATNDGPNALHGGLNGFDKVVWTVAEVKSGPTASATFTYLSRDGDAGYPGDLQVSVTYALDENNALTLSYRATTDKPTVVNLSNHSFFNLAGADSTRDILGQRLMIAADAFTPTDDTLIPTGELRPVADTPFDFRQPHAIGERIHDGLEPQLVQAKGYDHNFVLRGGETEKPKLAVRLDDPVSGRVMELWTTEPGVQFYSGNFLDGTVVGKDGYIYRQSDGLALEPQHFPDSPNHPAFPSTRLDPGQVYRQVSVYRFSTESAPKPD
jgi:aldose 1-epimerase